MRDTVSSCSVNEIDSNFNDVDWDWSRCCNWLSYCCAVFNDFRSIEDRLVMVLMWIRESASATELSLPLTCVRSEDIMSR